jgi:hypothetical protein
MTHDYKRHGTTTLFAALDVHDGTVIGRCMQRHRHQEFIRFLNAIKAEVRNFWTNSGSVESLNCHTRCGCSPAELTLIPGSSGRTSD